MALRADILLLMGSSLIAQCSGDKQPIDLNEMKQNEVTSVEAGIAKCGLDATNYSVEYVDLYQSAGATIARTGSASENLFMCLTEIEPMPVYTFEESSDKDAYDAALSLKYADQLKELEGDGSWKKMSLAEKEAWTASALERCNLPSDRITFTSEEMLIAPKPGDEYETVDCILEALKKVGGLTGKVGFVGNEATVEESN